MITIVMGQLAKIVMMALVVTVQQITTVLILMELTLLHQQHRVMTATETVQTQLEQELRLVAIQQGARTITHQ